MNFSFDFHQFLLFLIDIFKTLESVTTLSSYLKANTKKRVMVAFYLMSAQEFSQDGVKIERSNHETLNNHITITYNNQEMNGSYRI